MNEMKVREDLVFDRNGEIIGYVDVGDINNHAVKEAGEKLYDT